ncbi:MAG: methyltransferase domain-containing protein [Candidatus Hydrogenedentes bacterium]|nr:methyltransferase domain-containing protein [Candidatus Hydrogenedentota bacterium]
MHDTPEHKAREYFTRNAAFYTTSPAHTDTAVLDQVVGLANPQSHDIALDLATGSGHTAFALAPRVRRVIASDLTPAMVAAARALSAQKSLGNVFFCIHNADTLPFPDACFDLVTCRRACHHFTRIELALREMHRVLRPGGRLVIDDRSVPDDDAVDRLMNQLDTLHDPSHVRQYRRGEWQAMLSRAGLTPGRAIEYQRDRPLESLTHGAAPEDARRIEAILGGLPGPEAEKLHYRAQCPPATIRHWYLTILAKK